MSVAEIEPFRAYDLWAETYDSDTNPMVALSETVLECMMPWPSKVLELGCGTGRNLAEFARGGTEVLAGVDVSQGMLAVARRRLPNASLWCQDACDPVSVSPASFDLVLVCLVLEHVDDPRPVFAEAARVLSPGGRMVVLELHPAAFHAGSRARFESEDGTKLYTAAYLHTADELDCCACEAGFSPGELEDVHPTIDLQRRFPSRRPAGTPWLLKGSWKRP